MKRETLCFGGYSLFVREQFPVWTYGGITAYRLVRLLLTLEDNAMDDQFVNLGQEIQDTVQRVLDSKSLADLENAISDTVRRTTQKVADTAKKATDAARRTTYSYYQTPPAAPSGTHARQYSPPPPSAPYAAPVVYPQAMTRRKIRAPGRAASVLMIVAGFAGAIPLGILSVIFLTLTVTDFCTSWLVTALVMSMLFAGSLFLLFRGFANRQRIRRYVQYQTVIQGRSFCPISELTAATGATAEFVVKDLRKMVQLRMFPEGYLDSKGTCFMLDYATFQQCQQAEEQSRLRKEELDNDPEKAAIQQMLTEGGAYIRRIREINLELPAEDISRKLDTLEAVTGKIFVYVEKHPEKLPQIRKFLCYYLPTTLKLVETYRDLEKQCTGSETAADAKEEIRGALDKINLAFETLLDNLMQDDLLDLSADISALEAMMAQEGLTGLNFRQS